MHLIFSEPHNPCDDLLAKISFNFRMNYDFHFTYSSNQTNVFQNDVIKRSIGIIFYIVTLVKYRVGKFANASTTGFSHSLFQIPRDPMQNAFIGFTYSIHDPEKVIDFT